MKTIAPDPESAPHRGDTAADRAPHAATPGIAGVLAFLASFGLTLALVLAVNVLGNGDDVFPSPLRPPRNELAWKTGRLAGLVDARAAPQALILGSSRALAFSPDQVAALSGKPCFNFAAAGANIVECEVQLQHAIDLGIRPELIIVNVDEGMLLSPYGRHHFRLAGIPGLFSRLSAYEQLKIGKGVLYGIDLATTWRSLLRLCSSPPPISAEYWNRDGRVFLANGRSLFAERLRRRQRPDYDLHEIIARRAAESGATAGRRTRERFDSAAVGHLRKLLDRAQSCGAKMALVVTPEHPAAAGTPLATHRRTLLVKLQKLLREECERRHFAFFDFSNLDTFGGDADEFWDEIHPTHVNTRRMMNAVFNRPPEEPTEPYPDEYALLAEFERKAGSGN
ncbi:MAG: hypothetical protein ACT4QC_07505 [Planctomycetaceae bacterium]